MRILEGRFLVGRFVAVRQVQRGDGSEVPNFFQIILVVGTSTGEDFEMRAPFFRTDREGGLSSVVTMLENLAPKPGEPVAVRVSIDANLGKTEHGVAPTKAYANVTALGIYSAELTEKAVAVSNGTK